MAIEVTRTYLELTDARDLVAAGRDDPGLRLERAEPCPASFYRYLYAEVGRAHRWTDRTGWTDARLEEHLADPATAVWVLYAGGVPAGWFELAGPRDGSVEIAYFGLLPEFQGRGLGKHLLTLAVEAAWAAGARRVWLHTCTLDGPAALPNYLARGFRPYAIESYTLEAAAGSRGKEDSAQ